LQHAAPGLAPHDEPSIASHLPAVQIRTGIDVPGQVAPSITHVPRTQQPPLPQPSAQQG
jgi:hypothetical protein